MLLRPKLAGLLSALVASTALLLSGCSSSSPRDRNYGTDVGVGFVPPDVAPTAPDNAAVEAGFSVDSANADSANTANAIDGGVDAAVFDASIDGAD